MKTSKLTEKPIKVTSPFDTTIHKTERTANHKFVEWIKKFLYKDTDEKGFCYNI
jgi:hypothetical protein